MKKRLLSLLLALMMVLSLLPHTAWATVYEEGFGEEGTKFHYDTNTKVMTISGNGVIPSREFSSVYKGWGFSVAEVEKVVIKSGVTAIGQNAFREFTNLKSITIPDSVTSIGSSAFYRCSALASIKLPKNLKTIGNSAFNECRSLTSITIPATVTKIEGNCFGDGCKLKEITFLGDAPIYPSYPIIFTCTAYYPAGNDTWSASRRDALGSINTTWIAVCMGDHTLGEWTRVDENKHQRGCTYCDYKETADHAWDAGTTTLAPTCTATGEAFFTCTGCGATKTEVLPMTEHPYSPWEKVDDQTHTHTCTVCGKVETPAHSWDDGTVLNAANCIADGETKYTCTGCGLTRNEVVPMNGIHTYDHGCDNDCNVCGDVRTTQHKYSADWTGSKSGHWHKCVNCGAKQAVLAHVPGPEATEETPQTCTDCGYVLKPTLKHEHDFAAALTGDETGHWYACASCAEQKDLAAHGFDNDCDTKCDDCGFERITQHVWSEEWSHDEAGHFHACTSCGERQDEAAHDFRFATCKLCAYEDPDYDPTPVILAAVGGAAVCIGAIAAAVVIGKKKKKSAA